MCTEAHESYSVFVSLRSHPIGFSTQSPESWSRAKGANMLTLLLGALLLLFNAGSTVFNQIAILENGGHMAWSPAISASTTEGLKLLVAIVFLVRSIITSKIEKDGKSSIYMPTNLKFCLRYAAPGLLYALCNVLNYTAVEYIGSTNYQLFNNIKIITTAVAYRLVLGRSLKVYQWLALILLFFSMCTLGVNQVMLADAQASSNTQIQTKAGNITHEADKLLAAEDHRTYRLVAGTAVMLIISMLSACAGVVTEVLVKGSLASIWWQNVLLYIFTLSSCLVSNFLFDAHAKDFSGRLQKDTTSDGVFQGFTVSLWICILMKALYGQVVSLVFKYASNILKVYASSLSVIASALMCNWFIGTHIQPVHFVCGCLIILATLFYYTDERDLFMEDADFIRSCFLRKSEEEDHKSDSIKTDDSRDPKNTV